LYINLGVQGAVERKTGLRVYELGSAGSRKGLNSPFATASGIEKEIDAGDVDGRLGQVGYTPVGQL
jgi:hypothetical protein